eukprot:CAMPEP_0171453498 /NCGR_PEP_ID=MMETSP0945-20130129/1183_1 /TAXON_ID=109269 /ORGANISM="Vaucheria litorea, Strain CCMP2940" /LENGTH=79 /DNA_ID=CAMNT_0011978379 /DNA_START=158 /DNA_END=397 /DNA_ORIENTATION=-
MKRLNRHAPKVLNKRSNWPNVFGKNSFNIPKVIRTSKPELKADPKPVRSYFGLVWKAYMLKPKVATAVWTNAKSTLFDL